MPVAADYEIRSARYGAFEDAVVVRIVHDDGEMFDCADDIAECLQFIAGLTGFLWRPEEFEAEFFDEFVEMHGRSDELERAGQSQREKLAGQALEYEG